VLIDNRGEWAAEFDAMCNDYGIHHRRTAPQWPQCNGMAERLIKTIKHGVTVLSAHLTMQMTMQIAGMSNWRK